VSSGDPREWYVLLRETQGKPGRMLQAGVILDASGFPCESLFAEWGYVVDLDSETFEVYVGFQTEPHSKGRFADREGRDGYVPVALAASWSLKDLPGDDAFMASFDDDE
jgi:hypothetical protein